MLLAEVYTEQNNEKVYNTHEFTNLYAYNVHVRIGHIESNSDKARQAGKEIHSWLVGDKTAHVVTELSTSINQQCEERTVSHGADDAKDYGQDMND